MYSYREESDDVTESDDLIEVDYSQVVETVDNNAETIEKVINHRVAKKGGMKRHIYCEHM